MIAPFDHPALKVPHGHQGDNTTVQSTTGVLTNELDSIQIESNRVIDGTEFVATDKRREPTAYYGRASGVGPKLALRITTELKDKAPSMMLRGEEDGEAAVTIAHAPRGPTRCRRRAGTWAQRCGAPQSRLRLLRPLLPLLPQSSRLFRG